MRTILYSVIWITVYLEMFCFGQLLATFEYLHYLSFIYFGQLLATFEYLHHLSFIRSLILEYRNEALESYNIRIDDSATYICNLDYCISQNILFRTAIGYVRISSLSQLHRCNLAFASYPSFTHVPTSFGSS